MAHSVAHLKAFNVGDCYLLTISKEGLLICIRYTDILVFTIIYLHSHLNQARIST